MHLLCSDFQRSDPLSAWSLWSSSSLTTHLLHCFCWSLFSSRNNVHLLYTSLLSVILTFSCFCTNLNNSMSPSLKALLFLLRSSFRSLVIQGLLLGEHLTVLVEMVDIVSHTVSHGIDVISMWLTECIPVCNLKPLQLPVIIFVQFFWSQLVSEWWACRWRRERPDYDLLRREQVVQRSCLFIWCLHKTNLFILFYFILFFSNGAVNILLKCWEYGRDRYVWSLSIWPQMH